MQTPGERSLVLTFLFVIGSIVTGGFLLCLSFGVWLPDVFIDCDHILAEKRLPGGDVIQVVQYWNHVDFYSTELVHTSPNGTVRRYVLDGDDDKSWRVPLSVSEWARQATVQLSGKRTKVVYW